MITADIITVGKLKNLYWRDAFFEYTKRITPYAKIEVIEIPSSPFRTETDKKKTKKEEGERIRHALRGKEKNYIFLLDEKGKEFNSEKFADMIGGGEHFTFVVGGALGFEDALKKEFSVLSLSRFTLPHELARVVLVEQLYRAATILKGKRYHY